MSITKIVICIRRILRTYPKPTPMSGGTVGSVSKGVLSRAGLAPSSPCPPGGEELGILSERQGHTSEILIQTLSIINNTRFSLST